MPSLLVLSYTLEDGWRWEWSLGSDCWQAVSQLGHRRVLSIFLAGQPYTHYQQEIRKAIRKKTFGWYFHQCHLSFFVNYNTHISLAHTDYIPQSCFHIGHLTNWAGGDSADNFEFSIHVRWVIQNIAEGRDICAYNIYQHDLHIPHS